MTATHDAIDLFAGAGGWDIAAHQLGIHTEGVENDPGALSTRVAAELDTLHDDVWTLGDKGAGRAGLIASPPCQTFSKAGHGSGRKALDDVLALIDCQFWVDLTELRHVGQVLGDDRTALVLTPLHYWLRYQPEWVAWEQVPSVLPVWEACAAVMEEFGYYTWTGFLSSEMYGVAQTRKRAILMAHRDHPIEPPPATHSKYYSRDPERMDPDVKHWVSMAEALGWDEGVVGFPRLADTQSNQARESVDINGVAYRARDLHTVDKPAQVVTEKARSWQRWTLRTGLNTATVGPGPERDALMAEGRWRECHKPQERDIDYPAPTVTSQTKGWWVLRNNSSAKAGERTQDEPAPTVYYGARLNYAAFEWAGDGDPAPGPRGDEIAHRAVHPGEEPRQLPAAMVGAGRTGEGRPRDIDHPGPTMTGKGTAYWLLDAASWRNVELRINRLKNATVRTGEEPAATVTIGHSSGDMHWRINNQSGGDWDTHWPEKRPATTVAGREIVTNPGANANRFNGASKSRNDGIRVTVEEAGLLQSFPHGFPWRGSRTQQFQQAGNAIPPLLAQAVLAQLVDPR